MLSTIASVLTKLDRRRMIHRDGPDGEEDYLERFYLLSTPWLGIYLHKFWLDDDDGLHDHPWNSVSILLKGSYLEEMPAYPNTFRLIKGGTTIVKKRRPLHPLFHVRSKFDAHRITLPAEEKGETWSLFIRFGLKRRIWGFYRNGQFVPAEVQSRKDMQKC